MQKSIQLSKSESVAKTSGKKEELLKQLIQNLINKKQQYSKLSFTRYEIDQEIVKVYLLSDKRSIESKFNFIFRLGYIIQPKPNEYDVNLAKVSELDTTQLEVKVEDPKVVSIPQPVEHTRTISKEESDKLLAEFKRKTPKAICIVGSLCPFFKVELLPNRPCDLKVRVPVELCRPRFNLDGTEQSACFSQEQTSGGK